MAPWADLLYACDHRWWKLRAPKSDEFAGIRVQGHIGGREGCWPGTIWGGVQSGVSKLILEGRRIGAGGNSGFQALNFAVRTRASKIILLGYDFDVAGRSHWHGDHGSGLSNPSGSFLRRCAKIIDREAPTLRMLGVDVVNCSRQSSIEAFPRLSIEDALERFNKGDAA